MLDVRFRPGESPYRKGMPFGKSSPFSSPYNKTLDLLESELMHLKAKEIVIQAGFTLLQIRNDGWPRSGETPKLHHGVILSFKTPRGPLSFPCYRYGHWQANLRAVALSLQALRAVDRYGVTQQAEQYKGWSQIEAPPQEFASAEDAALFIARHADGFSGADVALIVALIITEKDFRQRAYRQAALKLHPDHSESSEGWLKLRRAMALLGP